MTPADEIPGADAPQCSPNSSSAKEPPVTPADDPSPSEPTPPADDGTPAAPADGSPAPPSAGAAPPPKDEATAPDAKPAQKELRGTLLWVVAAVALLLVGLALGRLTASAPAGSATGEAAPAGGQEASPAKPTVWTCSMHPQIRLPEPGQCPICGMDLIPLGKGAGGEDSGPRVYELSEAAAKLAEIETAPVERRPVQREVRFVGRVDYDETRLDYITAWFPGRLDRLFVDFTGTRVEKGDHLAEVYSPELISAQEELLQAVVAQRKLEAGGSPLLRETAAQTVASARDKLRLWGLSAEQIASIERSGKVAERLTVNAPVGGIVVHKNKNRGDYVKTGERIYTIARLDRLWVKLEAYESDLPWIRYGQVVRFETEAYPGVVFEGRVVFIDPVLDERTRTVKVRLNVDNRDGRLKPGQFVRATLEAPLAAEGATLDPSLAGRWICPMHPDVIKDGPGACDACGMPLVPAERLYRTAEGSALRTPPLVVPASAVLWTGVRSLVYVRLPGETPRFEGREVVLGPRAGDFYVIRAGLRKGELVVRKGAFKIDSALQIEARPSMMLPPEREAEPAPVEVSRAFREALTPVYAAALRVQEALAGDDLPSARSAAAALAAATDRMDMSLARGEAHRVWMRLAKRLRDAASALAGAEDLDAARKAFAPLAEASVELVRRFGHLRSGPLYEVHCPMALDGAGASWLQAAPETANPFYGASMLRCGDRTATFPPAEDAGTDKADEAAGAHGGHRHGAGHAPRRGPAPPETESAGSSPRTGPAGAESRPGSGGSPEAGPREESPGGAPPATRPTEDAAPEGRTSGAVPGAPAKEEVSALLGRTLRAYLDAQRALAADRPAPTKAAQDLVRAAEELPDALNSAQSLRSAARAFEAARGLEAQRRAFATLSRALGESLAAEGYRGAPAVSRRFCPMAFGGKGAPWLQEGDETRNPYLGGRMLRCGRKEGRLDPQREGGAR
ncbi:MAG: efflux RND transporter periplasmic adaptor subunit [Planctomycetota bacterium]|nr:MAG: efflux RND transporter periplasmic adaptor subunit [Planctomycetota bacterium]